MIVRTVTQPETQLGNEINALLDSQTNYSHIVFVSAFVALRTILRLREKLLTLVESGTRLHLTVGIDLGGTSREVMEELLRWDCETFVFHNTIGRATFHPKIYLFQSETSATLFVASNNLTDGGFYSNYEAATRYDFVLPIDRLEYDRLLGPLIPFIYPQGELVQRLDADLIRTLIARGELPTENEARQRNRNQRIGRAGTDIPASPFATVAVPRAPLLPRNLRAEEPVEPQVPEPDRAPTIPVATPRPQGILVWKKTLTRSDASDVHEGSHPKAHVVLTQADFESSPGQPIDQTTYFRNMFRDFPWEPEPGRHQDQEHAFIPFRIFIRGQDYGVRYLEVSHKPSGEAGQRNSPTVLRWGREFNPIIRGLNLTGAIFTLYETPDEADAFMIDIADA
jgi:hypothetical protein